MFKPILTITVFLTATGVYADGTSGTMPDDNPWKRAPVAVPNDGRPNPGDLVRCPKRFGPNKTYVYPHVRDCTNGETPSREVECSHNHWGMGVRIARNATGKQCA
jgi:hypothetical protein